MTHFLLRNVGVYSALAECECRQNVDVGEGLRLMDLFTHTFAACSVSFY